MVNIKISNNQHGTDIATTDSAARAAFGEAITGVSINHEGTFIHFVEHPTPEQVTQVVALFGDEILIVEEE